MTIMAATFATSHGTASAAVQPCSNGLVALTFDDGPDPVVTPQLLDILKAKRAPATFFVEGSRVDAHQAAVAKAAAAGFTIGNHTYNHDDLTVLTDQEVIDTLAATETALRAAGVPPSGLMRPPWGRIDTRVRNLALGLGLTPTLWNVESRDWAADATVTGIIDKTISRLVPDRGNIVLLHDTVALNLQAVPAIIDKARARGYCFADLGRNANLLPPVPSVSVRDDVVTERNRGDVSYLRFVVRLSEPTSRYTSVRVHTVRGTARPKYDYVPRDFRLRFPVGTTRKVVRVKVRGDNRREAAETLTLRATEPVRLVLGDRIGVGTIIDND